MKLLRLTMPLLVVSAMLVGVVAVASDLQVPPSAHLYLRSLCWLSGHWLGTASGSGNTWEAWYTPCEGNTILSSNKEYDDYLLVSFEFEHISIVGDTAVVLQPYYKGHKMSSFILTDHDTTVKRARFTNFANDWPCVITYEHLPPDTLRITLTGKPGSVSPADTLILMRE